MAHVHFFAFSSKQMELTFAGLEFPGNKIMLLSQPIQTGGLSAGGVELTRTAATHDGR
jgi:hypothetical protein